MSKSRSRPTHGLVLLAGLALLVAGTPPAEPTERISVSATGAQLAALSAQPSLSANGRYVAFASESEDVVEDDDNGFADVFLRDRKKGSVDLLSVASGGAAKGDSDSILPGISPNGRIIAFASAATTLVLGDSNAHTDLFVHDRIDGTTSRVSVSSEGTQGDGDSGFCSLSSTGRYVAFYSLATNLVLGDSNAESDVFVRDRKKGTTTRVSVSSEGTEGNGASVAPSITPNGRYVAMVSVATDLVLGDTNDKIDVFVHDRKKGLTTRESVSSEGEEGDGDVDAQGSSVTISSNGRYVVFGSVATNLVPNDSNGASDIFLRDRKKGLTTRISVDSSGDEADGASTVPVISANGRYVAFSSIAQDLVEGDDNGKVDIFVHDRKTGETVLASVSPAGEIPDGDSNTNFFMAISKNGRLVAFDSAATNLVDDDDNAVTDVFLRDMKK